MSRYLNLLQRNINHQRKYYSIEELPTLLVTFVFILVKKKINSGLHDIIVPVKSNGYNFLAQCKFYWIRNKQSRQNKIL